MKRISDKYRTCKAARRVALVACLAGLAAAPSAFAQASARQTAAPVATVRPERQTLIDMQRPVTIELTEVRLEEVFQFLKEFTGANIQVYFTDDRREGLDPDALVTLSANNLPALTFVENVLEKVQDPYREATWQLTESGMLEIGLKETLNRRKRLVIYDINDLLFEIPTYDEVPQIDLQSVLQQSQGGGGGGTSPFDDDEGDDDEERRSRPEQAQDIMDLLTEFVEPDQWRANGGDGGTMRYFQGSIIVNAPDYMHRQLVGYPYWPAPRARYVEGRRYVSMTMDAGIGTVDEIRNIPVTGVVPGGGGGNTPGGGG